MTTILLHGFWSRPADFNKVIQLLPLHANVIAPDLYERGPLAPHHDLAEWVDHFLEWAREQSSGPLQLVGYSMGARLSLNAVAKAPDQFSRVLLCSGRPVLPKEGHDERLAWEMNWREKFLSQPWVELESGWQEQAVFGGDKPLPRRREEILREMLGQSLVNWSPRLHKLDWQDLKTMPVDWAYGALDQKYLNTAKTLQELPVPGQVSVIPNAGHRIPLDAPEFVANWIVNA